MNAFVKKARKSLAVVIPTLAAILLVAGILLVFSAGSVSASAPEPPEPEFNLAQVLAGAKIVEKDGVFFSEIRDEQGSLLYLFYDRDESQLRQTLNALRARPEALASIGAASVVTDTVPPTIAVNTIVYSVVYVNEPGLEYAGLRVYDPYIDCEAFPNWEGLVDLWTTYECPGVQGTSCEDSSAPFTFAGWLNPTPGDWPLELDAPNSTDPISDTLEWTATTGMWAGAGTEPQSGEIQVVVVPHPGTVTVNVSGPTWAWVSTTATYQIALEFNPANLGSGAWLGLPWSSVEHGVVMTATASSGELWCFPEFNDCFWHPYPDEPVESVTIAVSVTSPVTGTWAVEAVGWLDDAVPQVEVSDAITTTWTTNLLVPRAYLPLIVAPQAQEPPAPEFPCSTYKWGVPQANGRTVELSGCTTGTWWFSSAPGDLDNREPWFAGTVPVGGQLSWSSVVEIEFTGGFRTFTDWSKTVDETWIFGFGESEGQEGTWLCEISKHGTLVPCEWYW